MAVSRLPEIFPAVKLLVHPEEFEEPWKVCREFQTTNLTGGSSSFSGTFTETENLFVKLSSMERKKTQRGSRRARTDVNLKTANVMKSALSTPVEPVEVDEEVMLYIQEKCSKELTEMKMSNVKMIKSKQQVTFRPLDPNQRTLEANLARERFVTFYQKISTCLQTRSYDLDARKRTVLENFPELLLRSAEKYRVVLTGSFLSLERFEQCLKNPPVKSSPTQINHTKSGSSAASSSASPNELGDKGETCSICLEVMVKSQTKTLEKCKHSFCKECLRMAFEIKPVCPTCGVIYGRLKGTQPEGGKMDVTYDEYHLTGYENCGTIIIHYFIPDGIQGDEHPNPGQPYQGVKRVAYLPNCPEGKKVLNLLNQAFKQRLIFTIGRSSTTGLNNVVTWNDIHHKTSRYGGPTVYGYPDPDYLRRVQEELKLKGIY